MANINYPCILLLLFVLISTTMAAYDIVRLGAMPDGRTDSAKTFLRVWAAACASRKPVTIYVPPGRFYLSQVVFKGPCNNAGIKFYIRGTLLAPSGYSSSMLWWVTFQNVNGVSIYGGTLDGRGQALWACKLARRSCPLGASSLRISQSKNVLVSGLTSLDSGLFHMSIFGSTGVTVRSSRIVAPENSPNTDGIHIQSSSGITITGTTIKTGDDCISMTQGTTNVWIDRVYCGPGHGISIGSLGDAAGEAGVQDIVVRSVVFSGTQNGIRIKTWGKPNSGFVKGLTARNIVMNNVQNPIIIDQNYCPSKVNCPGKSSGIKISHVSLSNIHGTSATKVAVKFDCSPSNPCRGVGLKDIKLTYRNRPAESYCKHVHGSTSGVVNPPGCLS